MTINKILRLEQIEKAIKRIKEKENIVLTGGCFDIIHTGHIEFLTKAKKLGAVFVLLESDEKIKKTKGDNRPIHNQKQRAFMLSKLEVVDYIILLDHIKSYANYLKLVEKIRPDIIAISTPDPMKKEKLAQAKRVGAKLIGVVKINKKYSTTKIIKQLEAEQ